MERMRTWRVYLTERLADDQEAAIRYLKFSLEEYQVDGDTPLLLLAFRTVIESQGGISVLAKKTGISQNLSPPFCLASKHRGLTRSLSSTHSEVGSRLNQ